MKEYDVYIFDCDGTLYHQLPMQLIMGISLLICEPKAIPIILSFRKARESMETYQDDKIISTIVKKYNKTSEYVSNCINKWMYQKPLKYISILKNRQICNLLKSAKHNKKKVIVYSDYPAKEKLKKLGIIDFVDLIITPDEAKCLKPNPSGIEKILDKTEKTLVIGDRQSKDGLLARNLGFEFKKV